MHSNEFKVVDGGCSLKMRVALLPNLNQNALHAKRPVRKILTCDLLGNVRCV